MKIEFRKPSAEDVDLFTLKQIRGKTGIYAPVGYDDVRIIVNGSGGAFFVDEKGEIEVLVLRNWQEDRFVKTDEEIVIRG